MGRDALGVDHLETVHLQQVLQAVQRVVAEVLVVDGVVLQRLEQGDQVVRLRDEDAVVIQEMKDAVEDVVDVLHVREDVGGRDDRRRDRLRC